MKKALVLFLALALSLSLVACNEQDRPTNSTGESQPTESLPTESTPAAPQYSQGLQYIPNSEGNGYAVSSLGSCFDSEIIIPHEYEGKPVTAIGEKAFSGYAFIQSVSIPDSVSTIAESAFLNCNGLISITIPYSVTEIGRYAFSGCSNLTDIRYTGTKVQWEAISKGLQWHDTLYKLTCSDYVTPDAVIPVEGEPYKMVVDQKNLGKVLFFLGETLNEKYIKTTVDPTKAADFYVEKIGDDGYKFYTIADGEKLYLNANLIRDEYSQKIRKELNFTSETDSVFYLNVSAWMVGNQDTEFGIGTYADYDTISLSESTYFQPGSIGETQFVMFLLPKEAAEEMTPTE